MLSPVLMVLGMGMVVVGFWATYSRGRAAVSCLVPVGYLLFIVGLIRLLIPKFFPF